MTSPDLDTVQKVTSVANALLAGKLKVRPEDKSWVEELLNAPKGPTGLVDVSGLSPRTRALARATALALMHINQGSFQAKDSVVKLSHQDAQTQLFSLFAALFSALVGQGYEYVTFDEIRDRMAHRVRHEEDTFAASVNKAADELGAFYNANAQAMFSTAKGLGGVKTVLGGQRTFGAPALEATRISGMYVDTQLIPDPVYPFLAGELNLNAMHLQLAHVLFHLLQLRPLVDAELPEPPIFIFPSFEEPLEKGDAHTQAGLADLVVQVVSPTLDAKVASIDELFDYAFKQETNFLNAVTKERLFVPQGADPSLPIDWRDGIDLHMTGTKGIIDEREWTALSRLPSGVLVLNLIMGRLRPQYHLQENTSELNAQALLSQPVHWHYFERCSTAVARELVNKKVLSEQAFVTLRALQDESLGWLGSIPIEGLVELRANMEHAQLREELKKYTAQLASVGVLGLSDTVREVNHGLQALVQKQQKAIRDIQDKYAPKRWAAIAGSAAAALAGAGMYFAPSLAAALGTTATAGAAIGALGVGGGAYLKEIVGERVEQRRGQRTMLGMLALAHHKSKK